jgi:hypothetical protein
MTTFVIPDLIVNLELSGIQHKDLRGKPGDDTLSVIPAKAGTFTLSSHH